MQKLPYPLDFMHKFNLHKWSGFTIGDDELAAIARLYGVSRGKLARIDRGYREHVARLAATLPPRAAKPLEKPLVFMALGDSISSDRESYAKILNQYWREDPQRRFLDCAVSGDTTYNLLNRFYATVVNQSFDWVVLFIGTNDSRQLDDPARITFLSLEDYRRNLEYLTDRLLERGKRLVLVTLPPADNARFQAFVPDFKQCYDAAHLEKANHFLRELAAKKGLGLADLAAAIQAQKEEVLEPDGLHLNSTGHLILCRLLLDILP
jgi:lysophospholipase L1-like esterase